MSLHDVAPGLQDNVQALAKEMFTQLVVKGFPTLVGGPSTEDDDIYTDMARHCLLAASRFFEALHGDEG